MNRKRIPAKKNYFSFLSALAESQVVRNGLFLIAGLVVILLCWFVFSSADMDASTIFGVLALFVIPLIIIAIIMLGFKKITGLSCLQGVEWVGKYTLLFFDWIVTGIQSWLGIGTIKTRQAVTDMPETQQSASQSDESLNMPVAGTAQKIEPEFTDFTIQQKPQALAQGLESIVPEAPLLKTDDDEEYHASVFTSPPALDDEAARVVADSIEPFPEGEHSEITAMAAIEPADNLEEPVQEFPFNKAIAELPDEQPDLLKEEPSPVIPLPITDEEEIETQVDFRQHEKGAGDGALAEPEGKAEESSFMAALSGEPKKSEEQLDSSLKALLDEAENKVLDLESFINESAFIGETRETDENDVSQLIASIDEINTETEAADPVIQPSMLAQAEQTAANILSMFSEKLSGISELSSKQYSTQQQAEYQLPATDLLQDRQQTVTGYSKEKLEEMSRTVERVLKDYKVIAEVVGADPGPIITRFELLLAPGVKVSRVSGLAKDLARAMLVTSVRVVEIIEGTPFVGLEIPNNERELVSFREIITSDKFQQAVSPITFALGKDVSGQTIISDLAKMPHLLVAGTTGSGKSVAINTMILSMLYKATPEQVRMIMIDPKMLELSIYEGIPHLLTPVVTDMKEAQSALRWAVAEMERRYKLMSKVGVRNLAGFNQKIEDAAAQGETIRDPLFQLTEPLGDGESFPVLSALPSIVIVIDELADMMMIVGKKVEELIARLAQKARAAGIHLVLATQRPSVDVLTGLIKANVPTRISFQVSSRIDSRTILDQGGAEALLGNGDMLFLPSGTSIPLRAHGAFVGDDEVHAVVDYLKTQGAPDYLTVITQDAAAAQNTHSGAVQDEVDALYDDAVSFVRETGKASISSVQRRFKIGYNRAARIIDKMEQEQIISVSEGNGSRRVLNREE